MKSKRTIKILSLTLILFLCKGCFLDSGKGKFIEKFDLKLKGEVLSITENNYNQYLVCLKVLESNKTEYFPLFEPFEKDMNGKSQLDKRFFIKVQDSLALIILYNGETGQKILHNKIRNKSILEINMDGEKTYDVYDEKTEEFIGGRKISTSPLRNNIEISCLNGK